MIASRIESDFLRYLLTHDCQPGARLPSLDEISAEVGISVGKLREQFEVARTLRLVEASPRKGIRCLAYDFQPAVRLSLMVALALDRSAFRAFAELRIHLETSFWDEAVSQLQAEDIGRLDQLVAQAQAKLSEDRIQIPHPEHRQFHLTIFSRLHNPFVQGLLAAYWDAYEAVEFNTYADYSYLQEVWSYHERIVRAIAAGEAGRAAGKELLIQHMRLIDKMGVAHELSLPTNTRQNQGVLL